MKKYELTEKLKSGLYGLTGVIGGREYFQKPWTEFTQEELKHYSENVNEETRNKHIVIIEVKENKKDDKAKKKQPKAEDANTGQEPKDAPQ